MCKERKRTRDLLLEYDLPPLPYSAAMPSVYPWQNLTLTQLGSQLYQLAQKQGYTGNQSDFLNNFANSNGIFTGKTLPEFPVPGVDYQLYLDMETDILYYFKAAQQAIRMDYVSRIGAIVVGEQGTTTYLYIPVRSKPLENLIYDSGDASEYID